MRWSRPSLASVAALAIAATATITPTVASPSATAETQNLAPVHGSDPYTTAVQLSSTWEPNVAVLFVASGESPVDGPVASSRAGAYDAPVLLTKRDALPTSTIREIERLNPGRVAVVGGHAAVSDAVLEQLRDLTSRHVVRINGVDHYDTAANAAKPYAPGVERVVLANGEDPASVLTAAALSGSQGVPILLTRADDLPPVAARQLDRLEPHEVVVVGDTSLVSDAVADDAASYSSTARFERLSGGTPYETAAQVAGQFNASGPTAYVASDTQLEHALAAPAIAARDHAPVVLTAADQLPTATRAALESFGASQIIVLGGRNAVEQPVVDALRSLAATAPQVPAPPPPQEPSPEDNPQTPAPQPTEEPSREDNEATGPSVGAGVYNGPHARNDSAFSNLVGFDDFTHVPSYYNVGQIGPNNWPIARDMEHIESGKTLLMGMASKNWNGRGSDSYMSWRDIARGRHDAEIRSWATRLGEIDREIWFAWDIEPDVKVTQGKVPGSWTAQDFAGAARRISSIMAEEAPKVQFTFWVGGTQKALIEEMYPGDEYVDIICWDPYVNSHRSPRTTPQELWSEFKTWLDSRPWGDGKTLGLCETGFHNGHSDAAGAEFWRQAPAAMEELDLSFVFYFHRNSGPNGNYTMENRPMTRAAYAEAMRELVR